MRLFSLLLLSLCVSLFLQSSVLAREVITSFVSDASLNESGVMSVRETIDVDLSSHRHKSLYRIIETQTHHKDHNHRYGVVVRSVKDRNGRHLKFSSKKLNGAVSIRLEKRHISKQKTNRFFIDYELRGVANFHENHPQLVFDVNGFHFPCPIENVKFELKLPQDVRLRKTDLEAWKGTVSKESTAKITTTGHTVSAQAENLHPGESLRVEVNFPIGTVNEPGFLEYAKWLLSEWYLVLALPLLAVAVLLLVRFLKTRMSSTKDSPGELWNAPEGLRPVEIGTLIDQSCDVSDVSVTLINLAVRGYYTVREIPATGYFALSDKDYEFKKLPPPQGDQLKEYESIFLEAIFGNSSTAYLSNIQGIFRQFLPDIRSSIYKSLVDSKLLAKDPEKDRALYSSIGFAIAVLGVAILFLLDDSSFMKAAGLGLVVSGILVSIAPMFIPLRTDRGNSVIDQIHLFGETLRSANEKNLEEKIKEDKFLFHKLLPYAIVLGVFEKWANACEEYEELSPDWFQFYVDGAIPKFSATKFAKDVWIATKVAGLTFTAPAPRQYSSHTVGKFGTRKEQDHDPRNRI